MCAVVQITQSSASAHLEIHELRAVIASASSPNALYSISNSRYASSITPFVPLLLPFQFSAHIVLVVLAGLVAVVAVASPTDPFNGSHKLDPVHFSNIVAINVMVSDIIYGCYYTATYYLLFSERFIFRVGRQCQNFQL